MTFDRLTKEFGLIFNKPAAKSRLTSAVKIKRISFANLAMDCGTVEIPIFYSPRKPIQRLALYWTVEK